MEVQGASAFVLDDVQSEPQNLAANFTAHVLPFNVTGSYDIDGVLLNGEHRVFGNGSFS